MSESEPPDPAHYFLSYSRSDERFALRLAEDIRHNGVAVWIDQLDIRPSDHWDRAIERAVRECRGLIVILSPRSVASDNVADEISFAIDSGKSVLPVMIEKCTLPLRITRMQVVDATSNYDKALQQCLAELTRSQPNAARSVEAKTGLTDPDVLSAAKRQLTQFVGPIAGKVVDQAATRASSAADLYALIAQRIDDTNDRERFLAEAPAKSVRVAAGRSSNTEAAKNISDAELRAISLALITYLGPIAPIVTKRESRNCASLADLQERLAALIPAAIDRRAFLQRLNAG